MLAIADSSDLQHAPFEILVTVDEERGLVGASNISSDFISGKKLINLDSEEEGEITIGSAGSQDTVISKEFKSIKFTDGLEVVEIKISGGKGGHSGIQIHQKIVNANVLMARTLQYISEELSLNLCYFEGGNIRNGVAPSARSVVAIKDSSKNKFVKAFDQSISSLTPVLLGSGHLKWILWQDRQIDKLRLEPLQSPRQIHRSVTPAQILFVSQAHVIQVLPQRRHDPLS